jgi:hypothetical protein
MREPREHLKTLQRRVDFLNSRDHKNSFDHAELGSLEWALVNIQTERKPLTPEQIEQICTGLWSGGWREKAMQDFARAIEAAHGIKGGA